MNLSFHHTNTLSHTRSDKPASVTVDHTVHADARDMHRNIRDNLSYNIRTCTDYRTPACRLAVYTPCGVACVQLYVLYCDLYCTDLVVCTSD